MDEINRAIRQHHQVVQKSYRPVMTVLVGSQNYGLDTETSDYDTCTFILPSPTDIVTLRDPVSTMQEDGLGHITIKDIRLGLNLLKKTSPNSVEWFATKHRYVEHVFEKYLDFDPLVFRCNTRHMIKAIDGLAHQLGKRNMSDGKRLSHILRMECMIRKYFEVDSDILSMYEPQRELALRAKKDPDNPLWKFECARHEEIVHRLANSVDLDYFKDTEEKAKEFLTKLQLEFTKLAF